MLVSEIIRLKRDGHTLSPEHVEQLVSGIASGDVSESQAAAFAMAVYFQGMTPSEAAHLTLAIRDSGEVLDWSHLGGPVTDKHSTGGVGDNVSLMLAPVVAACGAFVPMISGRGLGHTGGTLDKLEAIPGYTVQPSADLFSQTVENVGCAIIGQTAELAPVDKRLYAIRDVTATVESVPLITASILSKKLAAGLQSLVLDVKLGNGAFMTDYDAARDLAVSLTETARMAGLPCRALITNMDQPLAPSSGNAVEVQTAVDVLTGSVKFPRLEALVLDTAAEMLVAAGLAKEPHAGRAMAQSALANGRAAEVFGQMVAQLGGPTDLVENAEQHLPRAPVVQDIPAPTDGVLSRIDTRMVGLAVIGLGGGRRKASDTVDPSVGFSRILPLGSSASAGTPLARVHASTVDSAEAAKAAFLASVEITQGPFSAGPLIIERL